MIIVPVKEGENIEKALEKFKRKFEKTGVVKELRNRQAFEKPSVTTRQKNDACYLHSETSTDRRLIFFVVGKYWIFQEFPLYS